MPPALPVVLICCLQPSRGMISVQRDERAEYLSYVEAADLLAIFKLKAKRHLEANGSS